MIDQKIKMLLEQQNFIRSGLLPYYVDKDNIKVCLMIPSDPKFGGSDPQIAKGGIDEGLTPEENAIKEATEELGYVHKSSYKIQKLWMDIKNKVAWFTVKVDDMKFKKPGFETKKVLWLDINEVENKIRIWQKPHIKILKRRLGI